MRYTHPTQIPRSDLLSSMEWTGDRIPAGHPKHRGDTHPMTWASDDAVYIGTGDPNWCNFDGKPIIQEELYGKPELSDLSYRLNSGLCFEKLVGEPETFDIERVNDMEGYVGYGGHGPKPSGLICVDGKLYYAVQNLLGWKPPRHGINSQHGSDATIIMSEDFGKTWTPDLEQVLYDFHKENYIPGRPFCDSWKIPAEQRSHAGDFVPMFPGNRFGGPSFVQFGKDNADAVDDYVYAVSTDHWDNGSEMRLGRVPKTAILDRNAWEFAIPREDGSVEWTPYLYRSQPVLVIERHIGMPEMVYIPSIRKYITATWAMHEDFHASRGSELTILESDAPWGPFRLVHYDWMWYKEEAGCYCPRIPLKWFDQETLSGYLEFSGNWETMDPYYRPQMLPFRFTLHPDRRKKEEAP